MSKLHAQLALFGAIDEIVVRKDDPDIAATVERFLPGTTGPGQRGWYAELKRFLGQGALRARGDQEPPPRGNIPIIVPSFTEALDVFHGESTPGQPQPPGPINRETFPLSKALYASTIISQLAREGPLPLPGWDPVATDPLNSLLPLALGEASSGSSSPPPPPADGATPIAPRDAADIRDALLKITDRATYQELIAGLAFERSLDTDLVSGPPPCTGALRKVDGQWCCLLTTDWHQPNVTLAQMKAAINPRNWPELCDFFVSLNPQDAVHPDRSRGWTRLLETVSGDETQWRMRTALKFWNGRTEPGDAIFINYDLDDPRLGDDKVVEVDSGYLWITPADLGVRIRTSKAVRIRGLSPTATAALGCFFGWGDAASQMLVDSIRNPKKGLLDLGPPNVAQDEEGEDGKGGAVNNLQQGGGPASNEDELVAAAESVELLDGWRGALLDNMQTEIDYLITDVAVPLGAQLKENWSTGGLTTDEVQNFGIAAGGKLTAFAVNSFKAASTALRPPQDQADE